MDDREPLELPVERISPEPSQPFVRTFEVRFGGPPETPPLLREPRRPRVFWPLFLFVATCLTTFFVGGMMFGEQRVDGEVVVTWSSFVRGGLQYSGSLMAILLAHEMGHWVQSRRYGVPASWPWFIPLPIPPMGTMGAVIVQSSGYADRKQLFDIGITGPLAGLLIALPITILGLRESHVIDVVAQGGGLVFGNPPILNWLAERQFGPLAANEDVALNPLLHAGWVGIFVTALNLIPIGQLDGGHILYGLIRRKAHLVAMLLMWLAFSWMWITRNWSYSAMLFLLFMMGTRHPPSRDDYVPLGRFRILLGWLTLAFVFVGFTPNPITVEEPPKQIEPEENIRPTIQVRVDSSMFTSLDPSPYEPDARARIRVVTPRRA